MSEGGRRRLAFTVLVLAALAAVLVSLCLGRLHIPVADTARMLAGSLLGEGRPDSPAATILFDVRLPRVAAAFVVGASLALSGAAYQGLFRNPMVSPDMLGASAGAGFGAALAILLGGNLAVIQSSAFACGLAAVGIACAVGHTVARGTQAGVVMLVLAGMLVSAVFSAGIAMTKFCADPDNTLPAITFWLMGGMADVRSGHLAWLLPLAVLGTLPLLLLRWKIDIMCFGDDEACSLGVNVGRVRLVIIVCATLLTSASVALCGIVGFVGLIIPHVARLILGASHAVVLPASLLLGGVFLVLVDDAARCVFPVEVPLGILSSLIGAPFFLWLLARGRRGWM